MNALPAVLASSIRTGVQSEVSAHRVVGGSEADAAAWCGAFLARGALLEPGRDASLEVICPALEASYALGGLAHRLEHTYRARQLRGALYPG